MVHGWGLYFGFDLKRDKQNYFNKFKRTKGNNKIFLNGEDITEEIIRAFRGNGDFTSLLIRLDLGLKPKEIIDALQKEIKEATEMYKDAKSDIVFYERKLKEIEDGIENKSLKAEAEDGLRYSKTSVNVFK